MQPAVSIPVAPSNKVSSLKEIIFFKSEKKKINFFFSKCERKIRVVSIKKKKSVPLTGGRPYHRKWYVCLCASLCHDQMVPLELL